MILSVLKVATLIGVVALVWLPWIAWFVQRERARVCGASSPDPFQPAAHAWKLVARDDLVPAGADPFLHRAAPFLCFASALLPIAVIPFGASYAFGDARVSLVIADLDWGLLLVLMAGFTSVIGSLAAGFASHETSARIGAVRAAGQALSYELSLALSLTGMVLVVGSLQLPDVVAYQDQSLRVFGFLESVPGWAPLPSSLAWLQVPRWGIVLQPFGFVLFLICAFARQQRLPFDGPRSSPGLSGGPRGGYSGASLAVFRAGELVELWVVAALVTTFFLGGGAIPFLSQSTITSFVAQAFGAGFANGSCLLLQLAVFSAKVALVVSLQVAWPQGMSRLRPSRATALGWSQILPLSILNLVVTSVVVLGAPGFAWGLGALLRAGTPP